MAYEAKPNKKLACFIHVHLLKAVKAGTRYTGSLFGKLIR